MDLLKALKRTTILSAAISVATLFALGATDAYAVDQVSLLATANASVVGTLGITEVQQLNFGNMAVATGTGVATEAVLLTPNGVRTVAHTTGSLLTLLNGHGANGGITEGVGGNLETGGEVPGVYTITNDGGETNVYVSFATADGHLMDSNHGVLGTASTIGTYSVPLTKDNGGLNASATPAFAVDQFTFATTTAHSIYTAGTASMPDGTTYQGNYVPCGGGCTIQVGATLHTNTVAALVFPSGRYTGTYQIMVSY
jgi:hypothetical protein